MDLLRDKENQPLPGQNLDSPYSPESQKMLVYSMGNNYCPLS